MFKQLDLLKKEAYLERILSEPKIDLKKVRQYAWCGLPNMYRNKVYRTLLNVCGLVNVEHQAQIIELNKEYFKKLEKLDNTQFSHIKTDLYFSIKEYQVDLEPKISKQINIDVDRIPSEYLKYKNQSLIFIYKNILRIVAIENPDIGYVQGMADLLIPFIDIYKNEYFGESTIYFCFSKILNKFHDFFIEGQPGILESIMKIEKVLKVIDPALFKYFQTNGIEIHMFAFRWLNCLFVREFKLQYYRIILDSMLSTTDYKLFLIYFSISILQKIRGNLLKKNFDEALLFLQKLNQMDWTYNDLKIMFANAYVNVNIFENKFYIDF
ncbi:Ypt/Rab-specific GTPase-activating protein GYP1 [Pseudoloma neurophilia]|uniref:Ypt/Rab-specific GTPase-activating protein GYP1 n=1 Tax=Pseudoloma neurophilia TaxID=146866 RepID=A0A0R0LYF9_9MICR|nr:Ypt/Rab-specific GTPase-activating protein GYP1 [Pseudoloma neurophilia]